MIEIAGGRSLGSEPGERAPTLDRDALADLDPDVVLVKPCGFDLARTEEELATLTRTLPWEDWTAVGEGRVYVADGNAYFNRPGPRLADSLELLAACLHPDRFPDHRSTYAEAAFRLTADLERHPL